MVRCGELFRVQDAVNIFAHDLAAFARACEGGDIQPCLGGNGGGKGRDFDLADNFLTGLHVALNNTAAGAGTCNAGKVNAKFTRQPPRGGRRYPASARGLHGG